MGASGLPPMGDGSLKTIRTGGMGSGVFLSQLLGFQLLWLRKSGGALCPPALMEVSSMNLCSQFFLTYGDV